jgi:glycosyltransferase involved in cell wall biosynthesis
MQPSVLFVSSGLGAGGAERFLMNLCEQLVRSDVRVRVASLQVGGAIADLMRGRGLDVVDLGLPLRWTTFAPHLHRCVDDFRPSVIQGWMYHGNLAASLAARGRTKLALAWSIRQTLASPPTDGWSTRIAITLCRRLSAGVDALVYNSAAARRAHEARGFDNRRATVISNGFEVASTAEAAVARAALGLPSAVPLVGHVARWHPVKDHATMIRAIERIAAAVPSARFVFAGIGVDRSNATLLELLDRHGIGARSHLLGHIDEVRHLYAALDLLCLSSRAEAMPNAVGEAMANGTPCVCTDVGDTAELVGDTGRIVPAGSSEALADAAIDLLSEGAPTKQARRQAARAHIEQHFSIRAAVDRYIALYRSLSFHQSSQVPPQ